MFNLFSKPQNKGMGIISGIPNIIAELYSRPSCITDSGLYELESSIQNAVARYQLEDEEPDLTMSPSSFEIIDKTAIIPIKGIILSEATIIEKILFDVQSLKDLKEKLDSAMENPAIEQILFDVDSPGGGIKSVQVMAEYIAQCNQTKKIYTYTDGLNASACYWLTSGTERQFITPCSEVGSVGVVFQMMDTSRMYERLGVQVHTLKTGKYKGQGMDGVPVSEEFLSLMQNQVDQVFTRFKNHVLAYRDIVNPDECFQGQTYMDEEAIALHLVDYLVSSKQEILKTA